ncbi:MAG: response regulator, partial [Deltaproteobacteria bacterium]|nr:response regulator [Deltaproteobacteria bacterium]MBW2532047.1 response regulator [Deltaproteobacteria bacterium]
MPTILAVDDSATMRKALEITFAATEFDLVACATADEALEKVKTVQPAAVLVDVSLPPTDGYELCGNIKASAPGLPVMMLASKQNPFDPNKGGQSDANVNKPFDTQILADKVRELVAAGAAKPAAAAAPA